ncbi:hypothetical protein HMPREF1211_03912 [Streptomyces sp. HGB0020]|nr:hypothetical protein HMPREF1211_03912 [Streptomyces sp. HGB0020]
MTVERPTPGSALLSWAPAAVMAVVAGADIVAGPGVGFLPLVSLGPAFSGLVGGWWRTALTGAVALVLCVALGVYDGLFEERRGFTAMASVAGVTGGGVAAAVTRRRREAELASVRSIAEVAQRVLLRPVPRTAGPLQAAVSYTSAVAEARIGGDLYEMVASRAGSGGDRRGGARCLPGSGPRRTRPGEPRRASGAQRGQGVGGREVRDRRPRRVRFGPRELYTDGVTETRDAGGSFYPLGDRADLLKDPDAERALEAL